MNALKIGPVVLLLLLISGCFNYREEIVFDESGAGSMTYTFERGTQNLVSRLVSEYKFDNPVEDEKKLQSPKPTGLSLEEYKKADRSDGKTVFTGKFKFEHLDLFSQWKGHGEIEQAFGGISLRKTDNVWIFERKILPRTPTQLATVRKDTLNSQIELRLTGPGKLGENNATERQGNTCIWRGSFDELLGGPNGEGSILKAQYILPSSTANIVLWAVAAAAILAAIVVVIRKKTT